MKWVRGKDAKMGGQDSRKVGQGTEKICPTSWFHLWATAPRPPQIVTVCGVPWELGLSHLHQKSSVPVACVASDSLWLPCPQETRQKQP